MLSIVHRHMDTRLDTADTSILACSVYIHSLLPYLGSQSKYRVVDSNTQALHLHLYNFSPSLPRYPFSFNQTSTSPLSLFNQLAFA